MTMVEMMQLMRRKQIEREEKQIYANDYGKRIMRPRVLNTH